MERNRDQSILLSQILVVVFGVLLLALDFFAYRLSYHLLHDPRENVFLTVAIYVGSAFGWICLWNLWRLLANIRRGEVFVNGNVRLMRVVSWCCFAAALVSAICAVYPLPGIPFIVLAVAEGFMGLIVRIVKNAFEEAVAMKDELDLTV